MTETSLSRTVVASDEAYSACFRVAPPARVTIGVAALPKDAHVEIDAVVAVS